MRDDEPTGILTALGVTIHWTTPYHGQSKPIERAFRDLCEDIARSPACAGAYTGNKPDAKPENYGTRAIPFEDFKAIVADGITRHNRRHGRRSTNARGRSLAETFRESYEKPETIVRRASEAQRRMFLLAAEGVVARKPTGEVVLGENRYWAPELADLTGQKVVARFDPQDLFAGIAVYDRDGRFVAQAECIAATGFADTDAAREHARKRRQYLKAMREALDIERTLTIGQVADLMPAIEAETPPASPRVLRMVVNGDPSPTVSDDDDDQENARRFARGLDRIFGGDDAAVVPFRKEDGGHG